MSENLKGSNTEFAETQQKSVIRASMPAAIARYEQKLAHLGTPRLMPTIEGQHEQFYCHGYCDAIYDIAVGNVNIKTASVGPAPKVNPTPRIIRL